MKLRYVGTDCHNSQNHLSLYRDSIHEVLVVKFQDDEGVIEIDGIDQPISLRDLVTEWEFVE